MGACREGYNLFTKIGWKHLKKNWKYKGWKQYWFKDTFGRYICLAIGHSTTFKNNNKDICNRCYKEVMR